MIDIGVVARSAHCACGSECGFQVFLTVVEDALSVSQWGLYTANPAAKFLRMTVNLMGEVTTCNTTLKSHEKYEHPLRPMVLVSCPAPDAILAGEGRHLLSIQSEPSRGSSSVEVCVWRQAPVLPVDEKDAHLPTTAICVRPFRPYFHGTTIPSVSQEQIAAWTKHHLAEGIDRIYMYDYYEAGEGPDAPTLHNYLTAASIDNEVGSGTDTRVSIRRMQFFNNDMTTFDALVTKSYIYDQLPVMEQCFMQARREGVQWVLHIDFDEYMHFRPTQAGNYSIYSLKSALNAASGLCAYWDYTDEHNTKGVVSPHDISAAKHAPSLHLLRVLQMGDSY